MSLGISKIIVLPKSYARIATTRDERSTTGSTTSARFERKGFVKQQKLVGIFVRRASEPETLWKTRAMRMPNQKATILHSRKRRCVTLYSQITRISEALQTCLKLIHYLNVIRIMRTDFADRVSGWKSRLLLPRSRRSTILWTRIRNKSSPCIHLSCSRWMSAAILEMWYLHIAGISFTHSKR